MTPLVEPYDAAGAALKTLETYEVPTELESVRTRLDQWDLKFTATEAKLTQFLTKDPFMIEQKEAIKELAELPSNVLIHGPSGTGKQIFAEALHGLRPGSFVDVNCASLPEALVDSLLFGHVRGAFTGAEGNHSGFIMDADKGTLFLDEIHQLPLGTQGKLLKVLEQKYVIPVGARWPKETKQESNFRLVCATNRDLFHEVDKGTFLLDLLARILVFEIETTSLKDRMDDAQLIMQWNLAFKGEFPEWVMKRIAMFNVRAVLSYAEIYNQYGHVEQSNSYASVSTSSPSIQQNSQAFAQSSD